MARRRKYDPSVTRVRSAVTNGKAIIAGINHNSAEMRRLKDLNAALVADRGGDDVISEAERILINRASLLTLLAEMKERGFAEKKFNTTTDEFKEYNRGINSLRRVLMSIGLERRAKTVGPTLSDLLREDIDRQDQREAAG